MPELLDKETKEIKSNPETMESIRRGLKEIEEGKTKEIKSFQDLIDDLEE